MNENNVKIKIHEVNNTSPAGIPTDSTDIVFIPGFAGSISEDAAKKYKASNGTEWTPVYDEPKLCTTVDEFESYFGTTPYILTATDVASPYNKLGFTGKQTNTKGDPDRSYILAKELLYSGMPVVYVAMDTRELTADSKSVLDLFYGTEPAVKKFYQLIQDKGSYSVKYITSGGYPAILDADYASVASTKTVNESTETESTEDESTEQPKGTSVAADMLLCAATRGDAVALLDYQQVDTMNPIASNKKSFYEQVSSISFGDNTDYGALMYPWAHYSLANTDQTDITMPASYAYLSCVARAIKSSPNWLAMAGVSRGLVKGIKTLCTPNNVVSNADAEHMQPKKGEKGNNLSVNCITDIKPYGLCIWGNRTMRTVDAGGCDAQNFLNTRNMLSDIKKVLYSTARYLMFEQNSDTLWLRFKAGISPLLNQLKQGNGISDFKIIKSKVNHDGEKLDKGELAAVIRIYPIHAVEYFDLTVEINDEDVTVE